MLKMQAEANEGMIMVVVTHSQELANRMQRRAHLIDGRLDGVGSST
jgi:predicted ABC-type transport system involved in lysophospholipase L1 biosynthesis ATPase subunit